MEYQKYAVIDIGSNSLRLMTGWQEVPGTWIFSPKELATTRLGKDIDETHHLSPAGMEASFAAMERWKGQLTGIPVCAVATSAVREADDGQAFLAEVRSDCLAMTRQFQNDSPLLINLPAENDTITSNTLILK